MTTDHKFELCIDFIKHIYGDASFIPLHAPTFKGNEEKYLLDCLHSTFVSSVGEYVTLFEKKLSEYVDAKYAIATVNGTSALHIALLVAGVNEGDLVITQPLSFIATSNAINYLGAKPIYLDVEYDTLGLSPNHLEHFLKANCLIDTKGNCIHRSTKRKISACVPMHTFGHPSRIDDLANICSKYNIVLVEDAAESLGSTYKNKHTGTFGLLGIYSFNGNKTITCGGGGAIVTNNEQAAKRAKHLTTQAKLAHPWEYIHDEIGYNYRMPNLNASLACAQLEQLESFIKNKRETSRKYELFFKNTDWQFISEPLNSRSNYWLNSVLCIDRTERDKFLEYSNSNGVMTRPAWQLMNKMNMFKNAITDKLYNAGMIADRLINIPSSVI